MPPPNLRCSFDEFGDEEVAEQNPWAEEEELGEGLEQQQQELAGAVLREWCCARGFCTGAAAGRGGEQRHCG